VIAFPGQEAIADRSPRGGRGSPKHRLFMDGRLWKPGWELLIPGFYRVTVIRYSDGWGWRVEHARTKDVLWGDAPYPTLEAARRGCWISRWPGEEALEG
jgi:hypothetical protein